MEIIDYNMTSFSLQGSIGIYIKRERDVDICIETYGILFTNSFLIARR